MCLRSLARPLSLSILLLSALSLSIPTACSSGGGGSSSPTQNPVPAISSLSPPSATVGTAAQTLTINGSNFLSNSTVSYNGAIHTATYVSSTQFTIPLTAADQATAGTYAVVVTNPTPGGGASNSASFTVNPQPNPVPTISSLSPPSATVGTAAQTLTINGSNFLSNSTVSYNGAIHPATFVSSTQLTIPLAAADQISTGTYPVIVTNPTPGGGASNSASFTVNVPPPTATLTANPSSLTVGSASTLTWSSTNAASCTTSGAWTGAVGSSGSQTVTPTVATLSMPGIITYTLTCQNAIGTTATSTATLTVTYPVPTGPLSKIRSYEYLIAESTANPNINSEIANSRADLIVLGQCAGEPPLNRTAADPTGTKIILSYVDVAEALKCHVPSLFTTPLPSWFGNQNPAYPGLYSVQYWNPAWETAVFAEIDTAITNHFDGIFLDVLGGDLEWSSNNNEGNTVYPNATAAMVTLLTDIRNHVDTTFPGRTIYLMGNNPMGIAATNPASLKHLDIIFNESVFYQQYTTGGQGFTSHYIGTNWSNQINTVYAPLYLSAGVPVFGGDYPPLTDSTQVILSFNFYSALGWIPTVTSATTDDKILSTGPFMFMATPTNSTVTGYPNFVNYLSGGLAPNTTLIGGNQGDYFLGGPGQNTITGGSGNDTIYAHPANATQKNQIIFDIASTIKGNGTTPSIAILMNGNQLVAPTPVNAVYQTNTQRFSINTSAYPTISSVQIVVSGASYTDQNNFSNIEILDTYYNGVLINPSLAQYSSGSGPPNEFSNNGTVSFPGSALAVVPPFQSNTSDIIDGGGGTNTVIYRSGSSNYTVTKQPNESYLVTSASTAEGPDTLTNIQVLVFSDKQMTLP